MKEILIDDETNDIIDDGNCACGTGLELWDIQTPTHIETFKNVKKIWVKKIG